LGLAAGVTLLLDVMALPRHRDAQLQTGVQQAGV